MTGKASLPAEVRQELLALQSLCAKLAKAQRDAAADYVMAIGLTLRIEQGDTTVSDWPLPGGPVPPGWHVLARVVEALRDDWLKLRSKQEEDDQDG